MENRSEELFDMYVNDFCLIISQTSEADGKQHVIVPLDQFDFFVKKARKTIKEES